jgi:hypothetical protein
MGLVRIQEATCPNHLAGDVIKDVTHEVDQGGLDRFGDVRCFPQWPRDEIARGLATGTLHGGR